MERCCTECDAPLKENESGKCNRCTMNAGWYHDTIAYNPETDCMDLRKVKITCPFCGRKFAALLSKFTKTTRCLTDVSSEWHAVEMESYCVMCENKITFNMSCD